MTLPITFQSLAILLITFSHLIPAKAVDYPVGLSLGHYHLSSAYYNAENELISVVTINSSQEWQDYFRETWTDRSKHPHDFDPETISMFLNTLKDIQSATESTLSRPVEIRSITAPTHFSEGSSIFNLRRSTTSLRYFPEKHYDQIILLHDAARLAHNLDNCKAFGVEEGCNIFHEDNYAFVVEYSPQYLVLNFLDITDYLCIPEGRRKLPRNGEVENSGHLTDPNSDTFVDLALDIQVFMDEMIEHVINNNIKDPKGKVRGIILAGEASKEGMEDLKQVIETALPEYKDRFLFDIDPVVIGAVGAAHRARQWATKNVIMNPREPAFHDDL